MLSIFPIILFFHIVLVPYVLLFFYIKENPYTSMLQSIYGYFYILHTALFFTDICVFVVCLFLYNKPYLPFSLYIYCLISLITTCPRCSSRHPTPLFPHFPGKPPYFIQKPPPSRGNPSKYSHFYTRKSSKTLLFPPPQSPKPPSSLKKPLKPLFFRFSLIPINLVKPHKTFSYLSYPNLSPALPSALSPPLFLTKNLGK